MTREEELVFEMYGDLLDIERPVSKAHPPMDMESRAAQFLPFAALTGFDDAVRETARLTSPRKELTEERKAEIDEKLRALALMEAQMPEAEFTYYVEDSLKAGGAYVTVQGKARRIDLVAGQISLTDGRVIHLGNLYGLTIGKSE